MELYDARISNDQTFDCHGYNNLSPSQGFYETPIFNRRKGIECIPEETIVIPEPVMELETIYDRNLPSINLSAFHQKPFLKPDGAPPPQKVKEDVAPVEQVVQPERKENVINAVPHMGPEQKMELEEKAPVELNVPQADPLQLEFNRVDPIPRGPSFLSRLYAPIQRPLQEIMDGLYDMDVNIPLLYDVDDIKGPDLPYLSQIIKQEEGVPQLTYEESFDEKQEEGVPQLTHEEPPKIEVLDPKEQIMNPNSGRPCQRQRAINVYSREKVIEHNRGTADGWSHYFDPSIDDWVELNQ